MTLAFVVMIAGLIIWFIASKVQSISDPWLARLGEIMFAVGLFWVLAVSKGSLY